MTPAYKKTLARVTAECDALFESFDERWRQNIWTGGDNAALARERDAAVRAMIARHQHELQQALLNSLN